MTQNIKHRLSLLLTLCFISSYGYGSPKEKPEIRIGTTVGDFADMVKYSIKPQLEKKGYRIKLIEFSDYVRPNLALSEGSLDVNVFQHKPYLDVFSKEYKIQLTALFQVPTAPLGLYSGKKKDLTQATEGMIIGMANDPSNLARGLVILQDLGWIKLKNETNPLMASERDIASNPKKIRIKALEAAQIPRARMDIDFAIINGNYAVDSGIKLTDALQTEKSFAYINWGVVRSKDVATSWAKDVVEAYQSPSFRNYIGKTFPGYKKPQNWK
jgi:D-methionine transport system substrate-binding protein